ncbi:hypothetical protein CHLNCDRAFT_135973 [Chlorella variabilis]|uniref:Uncharacterized protein n=1 Tax=Chlorella variabilis TaxID=554065 RepID=E1ZJH2_CHLVA|nr:hypothetical protein CHLNCDRAFT_135973 [Chlorella variabilis]EFN53862.1 hypothetical protein CHLNCDRAFT_135973 [Chlorella variabilis]|eukprot:XP_005845964.1 hypothetical protein CHLNCDRAFT_135973 [Chlorella variabilis]
MERGDELIQAARVGNEAAVRQLLAAGARADQASGADGWLPLHVASYYGHEGVVRLLLEAATATAAMTDYHGQTALHYAALGWTPATLAVVRLMLEVAPNTALAVDSCGFTPLRRAAGDRSIEVVRLLLSAAPAAAAMLDARQWGPIHVAASHSNAASVQLLLEAAPELAFAQDNECRTPLQMFSPRSASLFADLVARLPLSQEQWHSFPAPCPDLARALPAVLQRSAAEAVWLVGRLAEGQRARLRATALSLARVKRGMPPLPAELSGRILALCLLGA